MGGMTRLAGRFLHRTAEPGCPAVSLPTARGERAGGDRAAGVKAGIDRSAAPGTAAVAPPPARCSAC